MRDDSSPRDGRPAGLPPAKIGRPLFSMGLFLGVLWLLLTAAACAAPLPPLLVPGNTAGATSPPLATATSSELSPETAVLPPSPCAPPAIVPPTPPAEIPGYTQLDPATGLHMTGTVQRLDLTTYRLKVTGKVDRPLDLTYDDLRCMPKVERRCTLVCPGFFTDEATWAGVPLAHVLGLAGVQEGASRIRLVSADGYSTTVNLEEVLAEEGFLAYEWEGEPVPVLHGFPLRAVFPGHPGSLWVKWLVEIRVE